jgi:hypothetical protein
MSSCSPANIYGPLSRINFLGCSVLSFSASVGWNEQASELTVKLVQDCGQNFTSPKIGTPHTFKVEDESENVIFRFRGILQSWIESRDSGGNPIFTVKLSDPRVILDGVQLIISDYYGYIDQIGPSLDQGPLNVFNIAGYVDATLLVGGGSCPSAPSERVTFLTNRSRGIPWILIKEAIQQLISGDTNLPSPSSKFTASPFIEYIGESSNTQYTLDIDDIPAANPNTPEAEYSITGPTVSLTELISQIAEDGGFDYYVELLDNNTIKFKTVFRNENPPSAQSKIKEFVGATGPAQNPTREGVISYTHGRELRNEPTSSLFIGSTKKTPVIQSGANMLPFFGGKPDPDNNQVIVVPYNFENVTLFGANCFVAQVPVDNINSELSSPIPSPTFVVSELEMRCALYHIDSFITMAILVRNEYINLGRTDLANSCLGQRLIEQNFRPHLVDIDSAFNSLRGDAPAIDLFVGMVKNYINDINQQDANALFNAVKSFSDQYYGKQWLVPIADVCSIFDASEYPPIRFNKVPSGDGAWHDFETSPLLLDLNELESFFFANDAGNIEPFVVVPMVLAKPINNITLANPLGFILDLQKIQEDSYYLKGGFAYVKAQINDKWYLYNNNVYALLTTDFIHSLNPSPDPNIKLNKDTGALAVLNTQNAANLPNNVPTIELGSFIFGIAGQALAPNFAFCPIQENLDTYGPFGFRSPIGGKVRVDVDEGLNPWSYGSNTNMLNATLQRLYNSDRSQMTETERGSIQVAGFPSGNLGTPLIQGGPTVTQINCEIGSNGFTTDYQFSTYTPQFGRFSKQNAERLKEIGQNRLKYKRDLSANIMSNMNRRSNFQYPPFMNSRFTPKSAHNILAGRYIIDTGVEPNKIRNEIHTFPVTEFTAGLSSEAYPNVAFMSWDGLIRPVSKTGSGGLPRYVSGNPESSPNKNDLDPFKNGHDIEVVGQGSGFQATGITTDRLGYNDDIRFMALRGPLVIAGWGYDTDGKPIPNVQDSGSVSGVFENNVESGEFLSGYLSNAKTWPVAPVDMRFDRKRKVWVGGGGGTSASNCSTVVFQIDCVEGTSVGEQNDLVVMGRIIGVPCGCSEVPDSITDDEGVCRIRLYDLMHCLWREDSAATQQTWLGRRGFAHYIKPFEADGCEPKNESCVWAIHSLCCPNQASSEPGISYLGDNGIPTII